MAQANLHLGRPSGLDTHDGEPSRDCLVLVFPDALLALDDEVSLPQCPLVSALVRHLRAVGERL